MCLDVSELLIESEKSLGYENQWELFQDLFSAIDFRLFLFYKYHNWLGPNSKLREMLGKVVSKEEFEHKITLSSPESLLNKISPSELSDVYLADNSIKQRLAETKRQFAVLNLFERFELNSFQKKCVILAYAGEIEEKYSKLFGYLQDDVVQKFPRISLAIQLLSAKDAVFEEVAAEFREHNLFISLFDSHELERGALKLNKSVVDYIMKGSPALPSDFEIFDSKEKNGKKLKVQNDVCEKIVKLMEISWNGQTVFIRMNGVYGSGKRRQIQEAMRKLSALCLFVDLSVTDNEEKAAKIQKAFLISRIAGAYLCLFNVSTEDMSLMLHLFNEVKLYKDVVFLLSETKLKFQSKQICFGIEVSTITPKERLELFEESFAEIAVAKDVNLEEISEKFMFCPGQIKRAAEQVCALEKAGQEITNALIHKVCYSQITHNLDKLATHMFPQYSWKDIVLPKPQIQLLRHACTHVTRKHQVFTEWGFGEKLSYGKGLSILLSGQPGTGKTMCAQVIASELNMDMYKVNISKVISKYIGETEKNLAEIFREAKNSSCILFFDECDAIFSKRSEVKDSHDRNANIEVSYLLQQIEEHDGVILLATNLLQNVDAAFMRRITYVVRFPFPDAQTRKMLYERTMPKSLPIGDDIDLGYLAEKFNLSGGHIKNIVLSASFLASSGNEKLSMKHLLIAAIREMRKNDVVIVRESFREYDDLIKEEFEHSDELSRGVR